MSLHSGWWELLSDWCKPQELFYFPFLVALSLNLDPFSQLALINTQPKLKVFSAELMALFAVP